jgi:hypothetical protein
LRCNDVLAARYRGETAYAVYRQHARRLLAPVRIGENERRRERGRSYRRWIVAIEQSNRLRSQVTLPRTDCKRRRRQEWIEVLGVRERYE